MNVNKYKVEALKRVDRYPKCGILKLSIERNNMKRQFIFEPVAQNTVIYPFAQAISMTRGGRAVKYVDPVVQKEKVVGFDNLFFATLKTKIGGKMESVEAQEVALWARDRGPIQIQVNINDVAVMVSDKTTLEQAMNEFKRQLNLKRQRDHFKSR